MTSDYRRGEYEGIDGIEIPGSVPSVLRPSRNPFNLPYDLSEEKPTRCTAVVGDGSLPFAHFLCCRSARVRHC
ncbi:dentin sialophosphoprotein [Senna tora]|uniref:Dentin sialophosphoprotein n=1 Tax=Senna tora TaxID=362788 RepID=A0A834WCH7_9FABA|nr:dentin sialophosphoprotein [Senna tora]